MRGMEFTEWTTAILFKSDDYKSLIEQLLNTVSEHDNDFNGENGDEYRWGVTEEQGYSSNLAWLEAELFEYTDWTFENILNRFVEVISDSGGYSLDWEYTFYDGYTALAIFFRYDY